MAVFNYSRKVVTVVDLLHSCYMDIAHYLRLVFTQRIQVTGYHYTGRCYFFLRLFEIVGLKPKLI